MRPLFSSLSARSSLLIMSVAFLLAACGGGGGSGADSAITPPVPTSSTGTVVILLTDAPVDELSAINLDADLDRTNRQTLLAAVFTPRNITATLQQPGKLAIE